MKHQYYVYIFQSETSWLIATKTKNIVNNHSLTIPVSSAREEVKLNVFITINRIISHMFIYNHINKEKFQRPDNLALNLPFPYFVYHIIKTKAANENHVIA